MKYTIEPTSAGLTIRIDELPEAQRSELEETVNACSEGRCDCPSDEYAKIERIDTQVQASEGGARIGGLNIHLEARPNERIDPSEVARCLDHTAERLARKPE